MKYTDYLAGLAKENVGLKAATLGLSFTCLVMTVAVIKFINQKPLIIERGEELRVLEAKDDVRTDQEIVTFLKLALGQRFDTVASPNLLFLSFKEIQLREKEQIDLKSKGIRQTVIINEVKINQNKVTVDADRLLGVKNIRSAFSFPLKVEINFTDRSLTNPYGIVLASVEELREEANQEVVQ